MTQTDSVVPDPVVTPRSLFFALERFESLNVEDQLPLLALVLSEELRSGDLSQVFPGVPANQAEPAPLNASHDRLVVEEVAPVGTVAAVGSVATVGAIAAAAGEANSAVDERISWDVNGMRDAQITPAKHSRRSGSTSAGYAAPAAKAKAITIAIVMALSFLLTAGVLVWQNEHLAGPVAATTHGIASGAPLSNQPAEIPGLQGQRAGRAPSAPPAAHVGALGAMANNGKAGGSVASPAPPDDVAADEVPIELHFRHLQGKVQGSALSQSADDLVVAASVVNGRTKERAEFQISVAAYKAQTFGLNDGLDLQSGDQITLRSSPYRDRVVVVP